MKKQIQKIIIIVAVLFVISVFATVLIYKKNIATPASKTGGEVSVEIKSGEGVRDIASKLKKEGVLKYENSFYFYLKSKGLSGRLKAGTFVLNKNMNIIQIVDIIAEGKVKTSKFTVIEGWKISDIIKEGEKRGFFTAEEFRAENKREYSVFTSLKDKPKESDLEGYLYPDTYVLSDKPTALEVIDRMLNNFDKKLTPELREKISKSGYNTHEIITLASIVEKEVSKQEDRAIVAGIFLKRLGVGMALEADSTVNYATGKSSPSVSFEDLQVDSPYNTYKYKGLPPGPISNPSILSIEAVLNPKESPYFFYLNRQDNKETVFSATLEEHLENQRKYLGN